MCLRWSLVVLLVGTALSSDAETLEGKPTVKFLLSDAKEPDFDLKSFQESPFMEPDSVASESIILPTLNMESHPYAVVVVPDLNKLASKNHHLNLRELVGLGRDRESEEEESVPSSTAFTVNDSGYDDIPVVSIVKENDGVINLNSVESKITPDVVAYHANLPDNVDNEVANNFENGTKRSLQEIDYDILATNNNDTTEETNDASNITTNIFEKPFLSIMEVDTKDLNAQDKVQDSLRETAVRKQPKSLQENSKNSVEKFKVDVAPLEKRGKILYKRLTGNDIKEIYSNYTKSVQFQIGSGERSSEKGLYKELDPSSRNPFLSIQTLPIVNEFSSLKNTDPEEVTRSRSSDPEEVTRSRSSNPEEVTRSRSSNPEEVTTNRSSNPEEVTRSRSSNPEEVTKSRSSYPEEVTRSRSFETVDKYNKNGETNGDGKRILSYGVSTPRPPFQVKSAQLIGGTGKRLPEPSSNKTSGTDIYRMPLPSHLSQLNQYDQMMQLIKLRNKLKLLDAESFLSQNTSHITSSKTDPERNFGSVRVKEFNGNNKKLNAFNHLQGTPPTGEGTADSKYVQAVMLDNSDQNRDSDLREEARFVEPALESHSADGSSLNDHDTRGSILTWSKFIRSSDDKVVTEAEPKPVSNIWQNEYNPLESIKTPIRSHINLHTRQEILPKIKNKIEFEKFDISNVISRKNDSAKVEGYPDTTGPNLTGFNGVAKVNINPSYFDFSKFGGEEKFDDKEEEAGKEFGTIPEVVNPIVKNSQPRIQQKVLLQPTLVSEIKDPSESTPCLRTEDCLSRSPTDEECVASDEKCQDRTKKREIDATSPTSPSPVSLIKLIPYEETVYFPQPKQPFPTEKPLQIQDSGREETALEGDQTLTVTTTLRTTVTETKIADRTAYQTITKTLHMSPLYTSTILHVMPDPTTFTVTVSPSTVTRTVSSASTVTHTLYSPDCRRQRNVQPTRDVVSFYNNNKNNVNHNDLGVEIQGNGIFGTNFAFNEKFWPKAFKDGDTSSEDSLFPQESSQHLRFAFPNQEGQESSFADREIPPIARNRQRMSRDVKFFDRAELIYGVPFYGVHQRTRSTETS